MTSPDDMSVGDDLLRWCSEVEAGAWSSFREAAAHVAATRATKGRPAQFASALSRLGHLDICWEREIWSIAPPCLALSPGMGLCAYLSGWRPDSLIRRYRELREDVGMFPFDTPQGMAPTAMFAKFSSVELIESTADALGIPVVFDPSLQLAALLTAPSIDNAALAAPPPVGETLRRFDPLSLKWLDVNHRDVAGLYEFELHGRKVYRLLIEGDWRIADRATGQLQFLQGRPGLIRWHQASPDMSTAEALTVPLEISLTSVAERSLVSACGLLPVLDRGLRIYRNVRQPVASMVADRLGLPLDIVKSRTVVQIGKTQWPHRFQCSNAFVVSSSDTTEPPTA